MFHNITNTFQHLYAEPYQHQTQETQSLNYSSNMCSAVGDKVSVVHDPLWIPDNASNANVPTSSVAPMVTSETPDKCFGLQSHIERQPITPLAEKSRLASWNDPTEESDQGELDRNLINGANFSSPCRQPSGSIINSPDEPVVEPKCKKKKIELVRKKFRYSRRVNSTGERKDSAFSSTGSSSTSPISSSDGAVPDSTTKGGGVRKNKMSPNDKKSTVSAKRRGRPASSTSTRKSPRSVAHMQDTKTDTEGADPYVGEIEPMLINQSYAPRKYPYYSGNQGDYPYVQEYPHYQFQQYYQQQYLQQYQYPHMGPHPSQRRGSYYLSSGQPVNSPVVHGATHYNVPAQYPQYLTPPTDRGMFSSTELHNSPGSDYASGMLYSPQRSLHKGTQKFIPATPKVPNAPKNMKGSESDNTSKVLETSDVSETSETSETSGFEIHKYFDEHGIKDPKARELMLERMKTCLGNFLKTTATRINEDLGLKERKKNDKSRSTNKEEEKSIGADMLFLMLMEQYKDSDGNSLVSLFDSSS